MTRSLQIANTSNHDYEDYKIIETDWGGNAKETVLEPGDSVYLEAYDKTAILIYPFARKGEDGMPLEPVPFYEDDKQVTPEMQVAFREEGAPVAKIHDIEVSTSDLYSLQRGLSVKNAGRDGWFESPDGKLYHAITAVIEEYRKS